MKAYALRTDSSIEPFGDHPANCLIGNTPLATWQESVLRSLGIELVTVASVTDIDETSEYIVFGDSLFFTRDLLRRYISASRKSGSPTVCALRPGLFTRHSIVPTQEVSSHPDRIEYSLEYSPADRSSDDTKPVVLEADCYSQPFPMPAHMLGGRELRIPLTKSAIVQVDHWANVWSANMALLLCRLAELREAPAIKLAGLALRARSLNKWTVLCRANRIGRGCDIHPTAYIEASEVGDGTMIGAGSVVRASIIGRGTGIGSNATIECSVIGNGCAVDSNSATFCSVLYPGAATSTRQILASLCGRDTFVADGVFLADYRFDGRTVPVAAGGSRIDTGSVALGPCLGHDVYLAAGCVVAPATAIPNGTRIVADAARTIDGLDSEGNLPGYRIVTREARYGSRPESS